MSTNYMTVCNKTRIIRVKILSILLLCSLLWVCSGKTKASISLPPNLQTQIPSEPSTPNTLAGQLFSNNRFQGYKHRRCGMCHVDVERGILHSFLERETTRINPFTDRPFGRIEAICTSCHNELHMAHPVGIVPRPQKVAMPPDAIGFRGEENNLTCMSCHDWHPTNTNYKYLRWPINTEEEVSQFCLNCHTKQGIKDNNIIARGLETLMDYRLLDVSDSYLTDSQVEKSQYFKGYRGAIFNLSNYAQRQKKRAEGAKVQIASNDQETPPIAWPNTLEVDGERPEPPEEPKSPENTIGKTKYFAPEMPDEFKKNHDLGWAYKKRDELNNAIIYFKKAIEIKPDFPPIYWELGDAYLAKGWLDEARAMFQKAISLAADFAPAYLGLGNVYKRRGNHQPAVKVYKTALKLDPGYSPAYYQLGLLYKQKGEIEDARQMFQKALDAADNDYSDAYYELGLIYKQNNPPRAQEMFKQAIKEVGHAGACYELGMIYKKKGDYQNAQDMFNQAIAAKSDNPGVYYELAGIYKQQRHSDKAISAYSQALKIDKGFASAYYQLGIIFLENRQLPDADKMLSQAVKLNPDYYEAYYKLAETCYRQKKTREAVSLYKQVIEIKKDYAEAYFGLGKCYRRLEKPGKAIANLKRATTLDPEHPQAHYILGTIFKARGQTAKADKQFKLAIKFSRTKTDESQTPVSMLHDKIATHKIITELDPESEAGFYNLGVAYMASGELDEAITAYRRAIDLKPSYWEALYEIALAYKAQNKWQEGLAALEQVVQLKPDFIDARHALAEIFQAKNQWDQAIEQLQQILSHKPDTITYRIAQIYYNKWQVSRQKNDLRKAGEYFERALELNPKNTGARNSLKEVGDLLSDEDKPAANQ